MILPQQILEFCRVCNSCRNCLKMFLKPDRKVGETCLSPSQFNKLITQATSECRVEIEYYTNFLNCQKQKEINFCIFCHLRKTRKDMSTI